MEDNFNQNDFEEFLQDQVRNHRMYPSDTVWREIDKKLHGEKRWPALTIAASMVLTATVFVSVYFTPKPSIFTIQPSSINNSTHQTPGKNILTDLTTTTPFLVEHPNYSAAVSTPNSVTTKDLNPRKLAVLTSQSPERALAKKAETLDKNAAAVALRAPTVAELSNRISEKPGPENISATQNSEIQKTGLTASAASIDKNEVSVPVNSAPGASSPKEYSDKNLADDFRKDHKDEIALHSSWRKPSVKHKFSYQLYAAPSISFRELLEDNSMMKEGKRGPVALNYVTDVNKVVRHKPGTGIEVGVSFMYNISDVVRVKSGFQFNMRQYSIEAYRSNTELASIALLGNNRIDTVNTLSIYRNNNGFYSAELVNRYYQLSVPVGIEWEILGGKNIHLNVAGTIQPTYLLNRNAYLLSTNFKNYAESPAMVRQWNLNSNIEAFISFTVGDFKWQLGPQLRYQPYSTFIPQYPIKEHLMDYGLKLGVSSVIK